MVTGAKTKRWLLNRLSQPGTTHSWFSCCIPGSYFSLPLAGFLLIPPTSKCSNAPPHPGTNTLDFSLFLLNILSDLIWFHDVKSHLFLLMRA